MRYGLIYDVGVNDGADSAYYLTQAERAIGIEADPVLCEKLRHRFAAEIADGRYILLNVGVAPEEREMTFWVCDDHSDWSSFDRDLAGRNGSRHHPVKVQARTFASIIAEYGHPDFAKIDIEGYDIHCIASLDPSNAPEYISVELAHREGGLLIEELERLGYRNFKIVNQRHMTPASAAAMRLGYMLPGRIQRRLAKMDQALRGAWSDGDWSFKFGSSGAFGEKAPGRWKPLGDAARFWRFIHDVDLPRNLDTRGDWFDIHAKR